MSWNDLSRPALALALAAVLLSAPTRARAQTDDHRAQASAHHEHGLELYHAGDYAGAAEAFEAAQALVPAPSNLFNLSRCYERLGDLARAISNLERYVASPGLPAERVDHGRSELERLRAAAGSGGAAASGEPVEIALVTTPAGAEVFVDGRPQEGVTTPATLRLEPGERMVEVRLTGYASQRQAVSVEPAHAQVVQMTLEPGEAGPAPGPPEAPGVAFTGSIQVDGGASFSLLGGSRLGPSALVGLELTGGIRFGRTFDLHGRPWRLVRFELVLGFEALAGAEYPLLEVTGGARFSFALGPLPLRLEVEGHLCLDIVPDHEGITNFSLIPAFAVVYRALPWLEIALRPARLEILDLTKNGNSELDVRWGVDAQVRFRI